MRPATDEERTKWGVPDGVECVVSDDTREVAKSCAPGGWAVSLGPGGMAITHGPGGRSVSLGPGGGAVAYGPGGGAVSLGPGGWAVSLGPGGRSVAYGRGVGAVAYGPDGWAEVHGDYGRAVAYGRGGGAEVHGTYGRAVAYGRGGLAISMEVGGIESDSRSPLDRHLIPAPEGIKVAYGPAYTCAYGSGWLRIGSDVYSLDEWIERAEEIDAEHGDGIADKTRALALRLKEDGK